MLLNRQEQTLCDSVKSVRLYGEAEVGTSLYIDAEVSAVEEAKGVETVYQVFAYKRDESGKIRASGEIKVGK